jgi:hypothetical protein
MTGKSDEIRMGREKEKNYLGAADSPFYAEL